MNYMHGLLTNIKFKWLGTIKTIKNKQKDIWRIFLSIVLFSIIFVNSGYTLTYINDDSFQKTLISLISFIIIAVIFLFTADFGEIVERYKQKKIQVASCSVLIFGIIALLTMFANNEINNLTSYMAFGIQILSAFLLARLFNFKSFISVFLNILFFISCFAVFFDIFTIITDIPFSLLPTFTSAKNGVYENYYFLSFEILSSQRLQGPFWEPGLFASFLLLGLFFEFIFYKKVRIPYIVIFIVAILLTKSTFGYLGLLLFAILAVYKLINKFSVFVILISLIFGVITIGVAFADTVIPKLAEKLPSVFGKMITMRGEISILDASRYSSPILNLKLFIQRPLFGYGLSGANVIFETLYPGISQTSTTTFFLTEFGIFGIIFTILFIYSILKIKRISSEYKVFLLIAYLLILNKEPHGAILFDWVFMFLCLKEYVDNDDSSPLFVKLSDRSLCCSINKKDDSSIVKTNIAFSYIVKGLALIIGFFSYPIYRKYFSNDAALGAWLTILSLMNMALIFDFGLGNGLKNKLIRSLVKNDIEEQSSLISSTYFCSSIISIIIIVISIPVLSFANLNNFLGISPNVISNNVLRISAFLVISSIAIELTLKNVCSMLQAKQKQAISSLFALFSTFFLTIFASIARFSTSGKSLIAIAICYILTTNVPLLVGSFITFKKFYSENKLGTKFIDKKSLSNVLNLGLGFFVIQLFLLLLTGTNETIISNIFGSAATVNFTNYNKPFIMIYSLFSIITLPYWSIIAKEKEEGNYQGIKKHFKSCIIYLIVFVIFSICLSVIYQPFINLWLGNDIMTVNYWILLLFNIMIFESMFVGLLTVICNSFSIIKPQIILFGFSGTAKIVLSVLLKTTPLFNNSWYSIVIINIICYIPLIIGLIFVVIKCFRKMKRGCF